jgi:hypothetical protein
MLSVISIGALFSVMVAPLLIDRVGLPQKGIVPNTLHADLSTNI